LSLRDGPNTRSTWRFKARTYPGEYRSRPSCSATSKRASIAGLPIFGIVFCLGQFSDVKFGVAERDQRFPARQYDRIEKLLIPRL
jgi:hypothetical protein